MTISSRVTRNFPLTEIKLTADVNIDYATLKTEAIADAKRELYGDGVTLPADDAVPDVAQRWIADKATVLLISTAKDFYMQTNVSISKDGATTSLHNKVDALDRLRKELEASLVRSLEDARDAIDSSDAPESIESSPAVSVAGLLVDPTARANHRGSF